MCCERRLGVTCVKFSNIFKVNILYEKENSIYGKPMQMNISNRECTAHTNIHTLTRTYTNCNRNSFPMLSLSLSLASFSYYLCTHLVRGTPVPHTCIYIVFMFRIRSGHRHTNRIHIHSIILHCMSHVPRNRFEVLFMCGGHTIFQNALFILR